MIYTIKKHLLVSLVIVALLSCMAACDILENWALSEIPNQHEFKQALSGYELFEGQLNDLLPSPDVEVFSLTSELFTDYASKQRLIKIPEGEIIYVNKDGTFEYPENTLIAKTFFYPSIESESNFDLQIIETRILLKINSIWNVAVYEWNREQTEAYLITEGTKRDVSWINDDNEVRSTRYRIPSVAECTTCHQFSKKVLPIGPKLSNMDHKILVNNQYINQLDYLEAAGIISSFSRDNILSFPDWDNTEHPLDLRARAYLEVNCAHCHNPSGIAGHTALFLSFDTSLSKTGITTKKNQVQRRIQSRRRGEKMPMIGTTIIHDEGVELIKEYLESL